MPPIPTMKQLKADLRRLPDYGKLAVAQQHGEPAEICARGCLMMESANALLDATESLLQSLGYEVRRDIKTGPFSQYPRLLVTVLQVNQPTGTFAELADAIMRTKTE